MRVMAFYIVSTLACLFALMAVTRRNPVHAAFLLVATLLALAVDFLLLGSLFIALAQVFVYAGAIVVLFVFVIMLLGGKPDATAAIARAGALAGAAAALAFVLVVAAKLTKAAPMTLRVVETGIEEMALYLIGTSNAFGAHALAFELGSVLVLTALVGAFLTARRQR